MADEPTPIVPLPTTTEKLLADVADRYFNAEIQRLILGQAVTPPGPSPLTGAYSAFHLRHELRVFNSMLMGRFPYMADGAVVEPRFLVGGDSTHDITGHKMGCDIHVKIEVRNDGVSWEPATGFPGCKPTTVVEHPVDSGRVVPREPIAVYHDDEFWDCRSYAMFGVLADVRNYSVVPPLAPRRGLPSDMSATVRSWAEFGEYHSPTYYILSELLTYNYDVPCEDRRHSQQIGPRAYDGGATCKPGDGRMTTYREHMGVTFFNDVERLRAWAVENDIDPEDVRIIFAFDN